MKMQLSCSCCTQVSAVTIKGIDKTDGTTIWEYGPGSFWRHHYGANEITGVVPNLSAVLNKYAVFADGFPAYKPCGNRNTGTLEPNAAEALSITKLSSLDGTVVESATLDGFFCDVIGDTFVGLMGGLSILNAAALSGGDYVIVGERLPAIEFLDYTSNTATKGYILHAHGQRDGNVYLKTRTSNETITIPQDSTAAEVETLFEATTDCVSATATGGPWPLKAITIEVEWSASSGDIAGISATANYTDSAGGVEYSYENDTTTTIGVFTLTVTQVVVGAQFRLTFPGTTQFTYTSTTEDISDFAAGFAAALGAFVAVNTGLVPADDPGEASSVGNVMTVNFINVSPDNGPIIAEVIAGGEGASDTRRSGSCAASYDTGTGEMNSSVGYEFGRSTDRSVFEMFDDAATVPDVTGLNVLGIGGIGAGPSNTIFATPSPRGAVDSINANVVEKWTIDAGEWTYNWQIYRNGNTNMPQIIPVEAGCFMCSVAYQDFTGDGPTTAGIVAGDASVTPYLCDQVSTSSANLDSSSSALLFDGSTTEVMTFNYDVTQNSAGARFRFSPEGSETDCDGVSMLLGGFAFGCDGSQVYALSTGPQTRVNIDRPTSSQSSGASAQWLWKFYTPANSRNGGTTQYRFRFRGENGSALPDILTSWLDWDATASEISAAIIAQFGENSAGGGSNAEMWPFGEPTEIVNAYVSQLEKNLTIIFRGYGGSGADPYGFIDNRYISSAAQLSVELRTVESYADPSGISAYDVSDASLVWSRPWGTSGATTISQPQYAWLQGDFVYAYGNLVDAEL